MLRKPFAIDGFRRGWLALGILFGAAAAALLPSGCNNDDGTGPEPPSLLGVGVSPDTLQFITLNSNQQLTVTGTTTGGNVDLTSDPGTSYVSRDAGVVTVSPTGSVTSVASGATRVVVTNGGFSDSAVAVVSTLTAVAVTPDTVVLPAIGARIQLTVTGTIFGGGRVDLTSDPLTNYISRDQSVVGVVSGGEVNAKASGQAYVVASKAGFSDSALADVDLASTLAVTSLSLSPAAANFVVLGDSIATTSTIVWENLARRDGPGSPIVYTTDDALVAEIDVNGVIVAIGEGSTSVHASIGGQMRTTDVTVAHQYSFAAEILPIFTGPNVPPTPSLTNCVGSGCHVNAGPSPGNGLRLDSYATLDAGSVNGDVVNPGDGANSRIIRALRGTLPAVDRMPQGRPPLPDTTIVKIENWIDQGALDN